MFYRRPEQMVLTFSLPAVICVLLGSIFSTKLPNTETSTGAVIAASMLAYGILSTSFINLGISIAADRDTGALRRLRGTPTTALSYFIGKICLVAIVSLAEAAVLVSVGLLFFELRLPTTIFGWFTLTWVFLLGTVSCSLLGIFISNFASNAVAAAVVTNGPAVALQFVSGTYVPLIGVADMDVGRRLRLSGQVDGSRVSIGAAAAENGRLRTGRQLGTLAHIPGADRVGDRRLSCLPRRFPVVGHETDQGRARRISSAARRPLTSAPCIEAVSRWSPHHQSPSLTATGWRTRSGAGWAGSACRIMLRVNSFHEPPSAPMMSAAWRRVTLSGGAAPSVPSSADAAIRCCPAGA